MKYDFTSIIDRAGKDALAIDSVGKIPGFAPDAPRSGFDLIPMWVADMNFATAPAVTEAIADRVSHPLFGYYDPSDAYYDAIIRWQRDRNGTEGLQRECIGYENGVLGGVASALSVFIGRGDSVLVHSPTYIGFTGTLVSNGYHIVLSPLVPDKNGIWRMDFDDMEKKLREEHIHAAIFCSPHNPSGRVWEKWEIEEAFRLYEKYDVQVISDEIWSDLILKGHRHIPSQSVSEDARNRTVALYAPSKTFNLAGLIGSYHVIYNPALRDKVRRASSRTHYNSMNVLSMHALIGAYSREGAEWVDELCEVLSGNVRYAVDYIRGHFEGVGAANPEGTYMLFADCGEWCRAHGVSLKELEKRAWDVGVAVQDGAMFHGPSHIRINLALPLSRVQEAMNRLSRYVF